MQKQIYFQKYHRVIFFLLFFHLVEAYAQNTIGLNVPLTFNVKVGQNISIALTRYGWILSLKSQSSKETLVTELLDLKEQDNSTIFTLTRDTVGESTLQFARSNIESAETETYTIKIIWNDSVTSPIYKDSRVIVMAFDSSLNKKKEKQSLIPTSRKVQVLKKESKSKKKVFLSKTLTTEENKNKSKVENKSINNEVEQDVTTDIQTLDKIKEAYSNQNYEKAYILISQILKDLPDESKKLFELAQYLENTPKNIRDILDAISFYVRIVKYHPLSVEYKDALKRIMFLQDKYIYVR